MRASGGVRGGTRRRIDLRACDADDSGVAARGVWWAVNGASSQRGAGCEQDSLLEGWGDPRFAVVKMDVEGRESAACSKGGSWPSPTHAPLIRWSRRRVRRAQRRRLRGVLSKVLSSSPRPSLPLLTPPAALATARRTAPLLALAAALPLRRAQAAARRGVLARGCLAAHGHRASPTWL